MHVVIAHYNEDLSWVLRLKHPFTVYSRNSIPDGVAPNKGREASAFLEYIITNYDTLGEYTAFVHGHRTAWHHAEPMDEKLNRIVPDRPYWNINDIPPYAVRNCADTTNQMITSYPALEGILGPIDMSRLAYRMAAQFIVHRDAIRSRSLDTYKALFAYLMNSSRPSVSDGILFERIWHVIFTHELVDV